MAKTMLISFAVGLLVGLLYGVIRVKSPAPPIIALLGLLGMVLGEQLGGWVLAKKVSVAHAATVCLVGKRWDHSSAPEPAPTALRTGESPHQNDLIPE